MNSWYLLFSLAMLSLSTYPALGQRIFNVNATGDRSDLNPGDGLCFTGTISTSFPIKLHCSLRAAIEEANATPNGLKPDRIHFGNIPTIGASTLATIYITSTDLPSISDALIIDGTTAPGELVLNGTNTAGVGLHLAGGSDGSTIQGLTVGNFQTAGLLIESGGNRIEGNRVGVRSTGTSIGNGVGIDIAGGSKNTVIGNTIGHNTDEGILVQSALNVIQANFVGADEDGDDIGNGGFGIWVSGAADSTLVGGPDTQNANTVGFNLVGIVIHSAYNRIEQNNVGTNAIGNDLGNSFNGIYVEGPQNAIGGHERGNIAGFNSNGIYIAACADCLVQGNFVGTTPERRDVGNNEAGIVLVDAGPTLIGGTEDGLGNVIGFNGSHGIQLHYTHDRAIEGNFIGIDPEGGAMGNAGAGIAFIEEMVDHVSVGSNVTDVPAVPKKSNSIAYNGGAGILLEDYSVIETNSLRGNRIHDNSGPGIDLGDDGFTENDLLDGDVGPNARQNFPEMHSIRLDETLGQIAFEYVVSSDEGPGYSSYPLVIDFYIADDSLSGEGKTHVGANVYPTKGDAVTFSVDTTGLNLSGDVFFVATATDSVGNTSEFSPPEGLIGLPQTSVAAFYHEALQTPAATSKGVVVTPPYPNPFNPQTSFSIVLSASEFVKITVHDMLGRAIEVLHEGRLAENTSHSFSFQASRFASGVYFLRVEGATFVEHYKLLLVR